MTREARVWLSVPSAVPPKYVPTAALTFPLRRVTDDAEVAAVVAAAVTVTVQVAETEVAVIKFADMSDRMQQHAVDCCKHAF